ncbi:hypothetical protein Tco_0411248 [Tanacetum coccineum]
MLCLDESYLAIRSNILTREPLPLVKAAFAVISECNNASASAFADVHSNNVSSNNVTTSNSHVSLSNERLARIMSLLNDNRVSTANANMAEYTVSLLSVYKLARDVLDVFKIALNIDSHSTSDHLCDTFNKAKQTRKPFPLSDHKSTNIVQLVHLDVCGPYKVISKDGFRYFLTIVDDFS